MARPPAPSCAITTYPRLETSRNDDACWMECRGGRLAVLDAVELVISTRDTQAARGRWQTLFDPLEPAGSLTWRPAIGTAITWWKATTSVSTTSHSQCDRQKPPARSGARLPRNRSAGSHCGSSQASPFHNMSFLAPQCRHVCNASECRHHGERLPCPLATIDLPERSPPRLEDAASLSVTLIARSSRGSHTTDAHMPDRQSAGL